jgi:hypothetical protein
VEATTRAPVEAVWPLVGHAARWQEWSFLTRTLLERPGPGEPDGVGAVRRFTAHGVGSTEQVVAWDPPHHLAYRIVRGFPVRNYQADVTLEDDGRGGTRIVWSGRYDPKIPGSGPVLAVVLPKMMQRFADQLAAFADGAEASRPGGA